MGQEEKADVLFSFAFLFFLIDPDQACGSTNHLKS